MLQWHLLSMIFIFFTVNAGEFQCLPDDIKVLILHLATNPESKQYRHIIAAKKNLANADATCKEFKNILRAEKDTSCVMTRSFDFITHDNKDPFCLHYQEQISQNKVPPRISQRSFLWYLWQNCKKQDEKGTLFDLGWPSRFDDAEEVDKKLEHLLQYYGSPDSLCPPDYMPWPAMMKAIVLHLYSLSHMRLLMAYGADMTNVYQAIRRTLNILDILELITNSEIANKLEHNSNLHLVASGILPTNKEWQEKFKNEMIALIKEKYPSMSVKLRADSASDYFPKSEEKIYKGFIWP